MEIIEKINDFLVEKAFAQGLGDGLSTGLSNLQSSTQLEGDGGFVSSVVKVAVPLSVICLILLVVYAGYLLMSSQGNPDKIQEGKEIITNAVIGFLVVLLSAGILLLISKTLELGIYN